MPVSHVVYGLRLAVNIAIPGLTHQPDSQTADVRIRLREPIAFPHFKSVEYFYPGRNEFEHPSLRVGVDPGGNYFGFFYSDGARFAVERQGCDVWGDWPEGYTLEDACTYLLGPVLGFVLRLRGVTCLHASAMVLGKSAIALTGSPGAGKSTLAAAFTRLGFSVLSDDVLALTEQGGLFLVQPGYPRVNLWPDSVQELFGSENALPRITPTWDKRYLELDQAGGRFMREPLPLHAIYVLGAREPTLSSPVIEEVAGREAFMTLVANTYMNYLLDRQMRSREFSTLSRIVGSIPVRRVHPTTEPSAVGSLCETIAADATRLTSIKEQLRLASSR